MKTTRNGSEALEGWTPVEAERYALGPDRSLCRGRDWYCWTVGRGWAGSVPLGPQRHDDIEHTRISWLSLNQKAAAPFKLMLDATRLAPPESDASVAAGGDWMLAMGASMSPHLEALAMVLPPDWRANLWSGLFLAHMKTFRMSVFGTREEAWRHLEAPAPVRDAVDALAAHMLREADLPRLVAAQLRLDPTRPLTAIAKDLARSERGLQRALAVHGETFAALRQQVRLELAQQHLASGLQVKAVAVAVGFRSTSHFVAWFRRAQGTTPGNRGAGPS